MRLGKRERLELRAIRARQYQAQLKRDLDAIANPQHCQCHVGTVNPLRDWPNGGGRKPSWEYRRGHSLRISQRKAINPE